MIFKNCVIPYQAILLAIYFSITSLLSMSLLQYKQQSQTPFSFLTFCIYQSVLWDQQNLTPDPLVKDDQALVANVRNKRLVILTACGHSGIINTINYAKKITGVNQIYAVVGGFHLPADGGIHEQGIEPTLKELEKADPQYIVPCHCTGWKATNRIIETFSEKFIQTGVGTTFNFNV